MSEGEIDLRPFTRSLAAPPARTLVDVLAATVALHPDATAVDDGNTSLTYRDLAVAVDGVADRLAREGVGRGDRVGVRIPSGTVELYVAVLGVLAAGAAYVPVDHDDPDARARLVFDEADVSVVLGAGLEPTRRSPSSTAREAAPCAGARRRRVGHLHLRVDRCAEGRGGQPSLGGGLR